MLYRNGIGLQTLAMSWLNLDFLPAWPVVLSWPALLSVSPVSLLTDLSLGVVLGAVGGLFGIGGGLIAIPVLALGFGLDQQLAQGTALVMIAPNVMLGFWRYKQRNPIDLKDAYWLGGAAVGSTWLVAHWATHLDAGRLRWAFAVFLVGLAVLLHWGARRRARAAAGMVSGPRHQRLHLHQAASCAVPMAAQPALHRPWLGALGLVSGVFSGLFTVGGGLVTVPALTTVFGVRQQTTAQGLSLAAVVPGALVALFTYAMAGKVDWSRGLPLAVGGLLSISWGVALAHRLPERVLGQAFCVLLLVAAAMML